MALAVHAHGDSWRRPSTVRVRLRSARATAAGEVAQNVDRDGCHIAQNVGQFLGIEVVAVVDQLPVPGGRVGRSRKLKEEPQPPDHLGQLRPPPPVDAPLGHRPQVVELGVEQVDGAEVAGVDQLGGDPLDQVEEMAGVAAAGVVGLTGLDQAVGAVLAEGFEQPVAALVRLVLHHGPPDQAQHRVDHVDAVAAGDGLRGGQVERGGEHGQAAEHHLVVVAEQVMGPRHRRLQGAVPFLAPPGAAGQQPEPFPQPAAISAGGMAAARAAANSMASGIPSRCRQISTTAATLPGPMANRSLTASARAANNRTADDPAATSTVASAAGRARDWTRRTCSPSTPSGSRLVTNKRSSGAAASTASSRSAVSASTCSQLSTTTSIRRSDKYDTRAVHTGDRGADRGRHRLVDLAAVGHRRQLHQPAPVGKPGRHRGGHRHGQAGLAHPAHPRQRHQPLLLHQSRQGGDVIAAADQLSAHRRQVGRHHIDRPQRREHPTTHLEDLLGCAQVPQPVLAQTPQPGLVGQPRGHLRAHRLAAMRHRHQPGRPVHRRTEIVPVPLLDLPGVQPHPHPQRRPDRPHLAHQRRLGVQRRRQGVTRPGERGREPVTPSREHQPAMPSDRRLHDLVMADQRHPHRVRRRLPQPGRPLHVGEQKRHRPRRPTHPHILPRPARSLLGEPSRPSRPRHLCPHRRRPPTERSAQALFPRPALIAALSRPRPIRNRPDGKTRSGRPRPSDMAILIGQDGLAFGVAKNAPERQVGDALGASRAHSQVDVLGQAVPAAGGARGS